MKSLVLVIGVLGCTAGGASYDETVQSAGSGSTGDLDAIVFPDAGVGSDAAVPDGGGSGSDAGTGSDGGLGDAGVDAGVDPPIDAPGDAPATDFDASVSDARGPGIEDDSRKLQTTFYACSTGSAGTGAVVAVVVVIGLALVRRRRVTAT